MEQNSMWLRTSLYCSKDHWDIVLNQGIAPFVTSKHSSVLLNLFLVGFNYDSGDNIRFSMLTIKGKEVELAFITDKYFKRFFLKSGFSERTSKLSESIFMPFPSNTIQYGLYDLPDAVEDHYNLSRKLSRIMIDALGDEQIDDETIITFSFYLLISWLKVLLAFDPQNWEKHIGQIGNILLNIEGVDEPDQLLISEGYRENRAMLTEIFSDIMEDTKNAKVPAWLIEWMEFSKSEVISNKNAELGTSMYSRLNYRVAFSIINHLAVSRFMALILANFIKEAFLECKSVIKLES